MMKIFEYLQQKYRVPCPTILTVAEAHAFGIKWPLQNGWIKDHGDREITEGMRVDAIERLESRMRHQGKNGGEVSPFHEKGIDILKAYRPKP